MDKFELINHTITRHYRYHLKQDMLMSADDNILDFYR